MTPPSNLTDGAPNPSTEAFLAQANFQRLRGEFEAAEAACLSVLDREPGEPDALVLLGDVKAEQGKLEEAAHWYGLALAAAPGRKGVATKLEQIRGLLRADEADAGAAQIGLPTKATPAWALPVSMVVLALVIGIAAYLAGTRNGKPTVYSEPISVPSTESPAAQHRPADNVDKLGLNNLATKPTDAPAGTETVADQPSSPTAAPNPAPAGGTASSDPTIPERYKSLKDLVTAVDDPRDGVLDAVFYAPSGADSTTKLAADAQARAQDLFARYFDLAGLTISLVDDAGRTLYVADYDRETPNAPTDEWPAPSGQTETGGNQAASP
jgi:tetratricopeptide (TPR) repeat protein